ncbi:hypothetical protein K440DRAFT_637362 [Wilcoxina mikolae CBS 423.85]|nr:hypothetical protein K440DRAFT_637362 [Wilcoxina mikolae CBS 423.85]
MTITPVNESSSTATAIKETILCSTITVEKAGSRTLVDQALATATRYRKVVSPTMVAPYTADSAKLPPAKLPPARLPPAKSPPAKLSATESSPTKLFPTMDLIPSKFMHGIYKPFADIHKLSNAQVAWLSKFEENNTEWRELGYKRYYDYLRTIDSSGRNNKHRVTKNLGDYWQQSPELLDILNNGDGSEKWLRLTALATRTAKDPELAKRYLNYAYVSRINKLGRKSNVNRWYTSADFKQAKALL